MVHVVIPYTIVKVYLKYIHLNELQKETNDKKTEGKIHSRKNPFKMFRSYLGKSGEKDGVGKN